MARLGPFAQYLNQLSAQLDIARWGSYQLDSLTPEVAHACAMLLGLALRGDLDRPVIRQLVPLLDGKTQVLREALAYLEQVDQDQALEAIASCLDTEQLAFVLMQTQDVMRDVDEPSEAEQALFDRLRERYDGSSALLATSLVTIKHKNSLSALGPFELPDVGTPPKTSASKPATMSPPQVLAESLLRITVADSVVDPQQLAYLGEVVARYPGLQNLAVQQARKVTTEQFILQVRGLLTPNQALCVLCQCAHLIFIEGRGSQPKWQVFRQLRDAWGLSERDMVVHLGTLKFNASRLLSRRDENAQPSAWGMRQDDWAAMKSGQGRPASRAGRGVVEEEGDVIRRSGDEGVGSAPQRPRGASAMHRGPIPAPRSAASSAGSPPKGAPTAAAPSARQAAPSKPAPTAAVSPPPAVERAAPPQDQTMASSSSSAQQSNEQAHGSQGGPALPQESSELQDQRAPSNQGQEAMAADAPAEAVAPSSAVTSDEAVQEMPADKANSPAHSGADASDTPVAAESAQEVSPSPQAQPESPIPSPAHDAPAERAERGQAVAPAQEPTTVPKAAAETAAASPTGAAPAPAAGSEAAVAPAQAGQPATAAPAAATSPQASTAPVAQSANPAGAGAPNAGNAAPSPAPQPGTASDSAHQPASATPAGSVASPTDNAGPTDPSSGQQSRERESAPSPESAASRREPESNAASADKGERSNESSLKAEPKQAPQADKRADADNSAATGPSAGGRQDEGAQSSSADKSSPSSSTSEPKSAPTAPGANASAPNAAAAGGDAASGQPVSVPSSGSPSAPAVAAVPATADAASPAASVLNSTASSAPVTAAQSGGASDNIQSVSTEGSKPHREPVQASDARSESLNAAEASSADVNSKGPNDAWVDEHVGAPDSMADNELNVKESAPIQSNQATLPQDQTEDRFEGAESTQAPANDMVAEDAAADDHVIQLAQEDDEVNRPLVDESALPDNVQTLEEEPSEDNRQLLDGAAQDENRQTLAQDAPEPNRQRVDLPEAAPENRQRIPNGPNSDKLLPQVKPTAGRAISAAPRREAEKVHTRVFETWQSVAQKEPEVVRKKAGFSSQIPPTIHRQRVIDFSSINIFLDYESDPEEADTLDANGESLEKKRDYDYKLQTCLDILRQQQDLVNDKLQRVQTRR